REYPQAVGGRAGLGAGQGGGMPGRLYRMPGRLYRLARKELREILRDRRTLVTLVGMPLLLYPLVAIAFHHFGVAAATAPEHRIAVADEREGVLLNHFLGL